MKDWETQTSNYSEIRSLFKNYQLKCHQIDDTAQEEIMEQLFFFKKNSKNNEKNSQENSMVEISSWGNFSESGEKIKKIDENERNKIKFGQQVRKSKIQNSSR